MFVLDLAIEKAMAQETAQTPGNGLATCVNICDAICMQTRYSAFGLVSHIWYTVAL